MHIAEVERSPWSHVINLITAWYPTAAVCRINWQVQFINFHINLQYIVNQQKGQKWSLMWAIYIEATTWVPRNHNYNTHKFIHKMQSTPCSSIYGYVCSWSMAAGAYSCEDTTTDPWRVLVHTLYISYDTSLHQITHTSVSMSMAQYKLQSPTHNKNLCSVVYNYRRKSGRLK